MSTTSSFNDVYYYSLFFAPMFCLHETFWHNAQLYFWLNGSNKTVLKISFLIHFELSFFLKTHTIFVRFISQQLIQIQRDKTKNETGPCDTFVQAKCTKHVWLLLVLYLKFAVKIERRFKVYPELGSLLSKVRTPARFFFLLLFIILISLLCRCGVLDCKWDLDRQHRL